ncbi:hypothetical protein QBC36DRAFT_99249 [Triangularia setosa]|uniref:Uncharacterized protein n=1 Tax=Triangularia setosa TaxID=2587417 RepID=A0AAN6VX35_9PEZI|nr:hypothetical protein QBC36DRAFT_99249 [Podospora setosa]
MQTNIHQSYLAQTNSSRPWSESMTAAAQVLVFYTVLLTQLAGSSHFFRAGRATAWTTMAIQPIEEVFGDPSPTICNRLRVQDSKRKKKEKKNRKKKSFFALRTLSPCMARKCNQPASRVALLDNNRSQPCTPCKLDLQSDMVPEICAGSPNMHSLYSNGGQQGGGSVALVAARQVSHIVKLRRDPLPRPCTNVFLSVLRDLPRCFEKRPCCTCDLVHVLRQTHQLAPQMWKAGRKPSGLLAASPLIPGSSASHTGLGTWKDPAVRM